MDILSTKEIIYLVALRIPERMKNAISFFVISGVDIFIKNEHITSKEHKTKNCLK